MLIAENIEKIEEMIQKACDSAGRKRGEITLMGVTKFEPPEKIAEAYRGGIRCFGESRVKEAREKFAGFKSVYNDARLHLIGSLQRNKVKHAVQLFDCIQSVDRNELIVEIAACLRETEGNDDSFQLPVLLEFRTGEETKSGYAALDELFKAAELALENENLIPAGLMTMAPFTDDTRLIRASFRQLAKARDELRLRFPSKENGKNWDILSMGMSNDFLTAIEEGSTLLRIGSAIFKE